MYSQNNEDAIVVNWFKQQYGEDFKGNILDLGANDGTTFSNSLRLIQLGWSADLIEASPGTFEVLEKLHKGNKLVKCHNIAVGNVNGKAKFYESGTLLGGNDKSLVSTLDKNELKRWRDSVDFTETIVNVVDFETLLKQTKNVTFDFITIDVEGLDWIMLKQMNLNELGCKLLIVETNGKETIKYVNHCKQFGFDTLATNAENLIVVKNG